MYEMERERERGRRPRRRDRVFEDDDEFRRRRSEPLAEDMQRMHIRELPRRDFMEESFAPPRERDEMVLRRSREERDSLSPEPFIPIDRDEMYMRPPPRRRHRPRGIDEDDLVFEERESRRGSRRHPRDLEEEFVVDERERHGDRRHRPERERDVDEELILEERGSRRDRRHRPMRVSEEDLIVESRERERDSHRRRRSEPQFEGDAFIVEQERRQRDRRPREFEEDEVIFEDREARRGSRRHPERRSEDDLLTEERERRQRRRRPARDIEEEEMFIRHKEREEPPLRRGWDSELDIRSRERRREFEEEAHHRPRSRPPRRVEVEEVTLDDAVPKRHRGPIERPEREFEDDDVIIRWKGKGPRPAGRPDDEELVLHERRERRRSVPSEDLERELRGHRREIREDIPLDGDTSIRSQFDPKSSARDLGDVEEEISIRQTKEKLPSRQPSPSLASIHVPPIHQDVFTHHRHIDHGKTVVDSSAKMSAHLKQAIRKILHLVCPVQNCDPREVVLMRLTFTIGRCPCLSSFLPHTNIQFRKMRGGRMSEENIVLKHRDSDESLAPEDSISPTSGPALDFHDPWDGPTKVTPRRRAKPLDDESELDFSHEIKDVPAMREVKEDIVIESTRAMDKAPKVTDDWSVVHTPPTEPIAMTGALDVVEVQPRQSPVDEVKVGRIAQQIKEPKETRNDRWTEIAKRLVVREAIEDMGFEYEETRTSYYIFSYLKPVCFVP